MKAHSRKERERIRTRSVHSHAGIVELWQKNPEQLREKHVSQVIGFCGEGKLRDDNDTSQQFRSLLTAVPADFLATYADDCLTEKSDGGGFALQDVVNEIGRRLGFTVTNGRYRGTQNEIGNDGLWVSATGDTLVVEVKTTDAYRIDLDSIAEYRNKLVRGGNITEKRSSILIVVGREDTGGFEAQVRGSRHAWDVRLISIDALLHLMKLREEVEDPVIMHKITSILIPHEYTKVDGIIDVVFSTAEDVRQELEGVDVPAAKTRGRAAGERSVPVGFNEACVKRIEKHLKVSLMRRTRAVFSSVDKGVIVTCAVSREYDRAGTPSYWFAFHPHQAEILESAKNAFVSFGCGSADSVILVPYKDFKPWTEGMHKTIMQDRHYWHIEIYREDKGDWSLRRKKGVPRVFLNKFLLA
jgi:hypothetical protein